MRPLGPDAREAVDKAMVARIATVSRNGRPNLNPLYFVREGDRIWLGTVDDTLAAHNVKADPRVAVLFEIERDVADERLLRVTGTARVRTDRDAVRRFRRRDTFKYVLTPAGIWNMSKHASQWPLLRRYIKQGTERLPCVIEVDPDRAEFIDRP